ncbi:hypothetical protein WS62_08535 [Burkholderia sp. ABCPW 14]|uniref:Panacea domain-containing protein n=1 Tax=Burkholderia TaxID=32008 RepID=UPI000770C6E7|nr:MULTISPECIES: type II toxin-antitoxin system antitoxin SocA domain-containing protein [Burkholderia]KVD73412.1 hypothetical protein WS62_08535 [Burkholderia sp. ABCPW 14]
MTISALQLAAELIRRSDAQNRPQFTTNLAIQKLAYFCHGWHLALSGEALVNEQFEAWRFGPVLPGLYHTLKVFSSNPIPVSHPLVVSQPSLPAGSWSGQLIDHVLSVHSGLTAAQLVAISHDSDGPWQKVWSQGPSSWITNESIATYFRKLANKPAH